MDKVVHVEAERLRPRIKSLLMHSAHPIFAASRSNCVLNGRSSGGHFILEKELDYQVLAGRESSKHAIFLEGKLPSPILLSHHRRRLSRSRCSKTEAVSQGSLQGCVRVLVNYSVYDIKFDEQTQKGCNFNHVNIGDQF